MKNPLRNQSRAAGRIHRVPRRHRYASGTSHRLIIFALFAVVFLSLPVASVLWAARCTTSTNGDDTPSDVCSLFNPPSNGAPVPGTSNLMYLPGFGDDDSSPDETGFDYFDDAVYSNMLLPDVSANNGWDTPWVMAATGSSSFEVVEFTAPGPTPLPISRSYDSGLRSDTGSEVTSDTGTRWLGSSDTPYLYDDGVSDAVVVPNPPTLQIYEEGENKTWFDDGWVLLPIVDSGTADEEYHFKHLESGNLFIYHGFDPAIDSNLEGRFIRFEYMGMPAGETGPTYNYGTPTTDELQQIVAGDPQGWAVNFFYTGERLTEIQYKDSTGTVVLKVFYTYFDPVTHDADLGSAGDLVQVKVSSKPTQGSTWIDRYTQYRYYVDSDTDGDDHDLKYVFESDAIERINGSGGTSIDTPEELLEKSDAEPVSGSNEIEDYASAAFTYYSSNASTTSVTTPWGAENLQSKYGGAARDETGFVKTVTLNGDCASCGGSGGIGIKRSYFYMQLNGGSSTDPRDVVYVTVEDAEDAIGTAIWRKILGFNSKNAALRGAFIENPNAGTLKAWCSSVIIDAGPSNDESRRILQVRSPSAHSLVDSNAEITKFLNPTSSTNDSDTINASDGQVFVYKYDSGGYATDALVREGKNGTENMLAAADYGDGTANKPEHLPVAIYAYSSATTFANRTTGEKASIAYTFWDAGTNEAIKTKIVTLPNISTSQNGSNTATTVEEYYDEYGRLRWTEDGEGYVNYISYHPETSEPAYIALDVDPASASSEITSGQAGKWEAWTVGDADGNKPTRSATATTLALVTKVEYDSQGRVTGVIAPNGTAKHYAAYEKNRQIIFPYWSGTKCDMPSQVTVVDDSGTVTERYAVKADYTSFSTSAGIPTGYSTDPTQTSYVEWARVERDISGRPIALDLYHEIPGVNDNGGDGFHSTNFHRTGLVYDDRGRVQHIINQVSGAPNSSGVEQLTKFVYDALDRVTEVHRGVSAASHNLGTSTENYNNYAAVTLKKVSEREFDSGGTGDGRLTKVKEYYDTSKYHGVTLHYTYRGHLRGIEPVYNTGTGENSDEGPYAALDVDWRGFLTAAAVYTSEPNWNTVLTGDGYTDYAYAGSSNKTGRARLTEWSRDDLGRMYEQRKYTVAASTGTAGSYFRRRNYYDRNDRLVGAWNEHFLSREMAYDGAGRPYQVRDVLALEGTDTGTYYTSGKFDYQLPLPKATYTGMTGGDKKVMTIDHVDLDDLGNPIRRFFVSANHDDIDGVDLTGNDDYTRQTLDLWYDSIGRPTTTANYGSGNNTSGSTDTLKHNAVPSRGSAATTSADYRLVTKVTYDAQRGTLSEIIDPTGVKTKQITDDLGRVQYFVENYVNFSPPDNHIGGGTNDDEDRVIEREYNGLDQVAKLIAMNAGTSDQETRYLYEDAVHANLATSVIYPDSTDTTSSQTDQVKYQFDFDGRVNERTDQVGNVMEFVYDALRRRQAEMVTTVGSGTLSDTLSITRGYDALGQLTKITSHTTAVSDPDSTSTLANQVVFTYNDLGQMLKSQQSHAGAVSGSTPAVEYAYDLSASSSVYNDVARLESITYPNSREVHYTRGPSNRWIDLTGSVDRIREDSQAGTTLAIYQYLASGREVQSDRTVIDLRNTAHFNDADDIYEGLDGFGRIVDLHWDGYSVTADAERLAYTYDRASNLLTRDRASGIYATNNKDKKFGYDGLYRLTSFDQGILSSGSISSKQQRQAWTLDQLGNWSNFKHDTDTDSTWELDQNRTHSKANELTAIAGSSTTVTLTGSGNMSRVPHVGNYGDNYRLYYDAWNRLVRVRTAANVFIATYEYDGLDRRIRKLHNGVHRHYYFSNRWQVLEERLGSSTSADRQYVWGPNYVDDLLLRDRDADSNSGTGSFGGAGSGLEERLYPVRDERYSVVALVDGDSASGNYKQVVERFEYTPYGEVTVLNADFTLDGAGHAASDFDWTHLFTGRAVEPDTGLQIHRWRHYHPSLGRWITRDPIGYGAGDMNLYGYVRGEVMYWVDPFGLQQIWPSNKRGKGGGRPRTGGGFQAREVNPHPPGTEAWFRWRDDRSGGRGLSAAGLGSMRNQDFADDARVTIEETVDTVMDFTPGVEQVKGIYEVKTGRKLVKDECLTDSERTTTAIILMIPFGDDAFKFIRKFWRFRKARKLPIPNPRFIPKPGIGTKADLPANIDDLVKVGRPIEGEWPAIMKDGKVYVDRFHSLANKRANGGVIGPEDAYGSVTLDKFGNVIGVSW